MSIASPSSSASVSPVAHSQQFISELQSTVIQQPIAVDAVTIYGLTPLGCLLTKLFTSVDVHVYLYDDLINSNAHLLHRLKMCVSENIFTYVQDSDRYDLPYLSSILINCQDDVKRLHKLLSQFPHEYKQKFAYIECSNMRYTHVEFVQNELKLSYPNSYYLCLTFYELDTSVSTKVPDVRCVCSGDFYVYQILLPYLRCMTHSKCEFIAEHAQKLSIIYQHHLYIQLACYSEIVALLLKQDEGNLERFQFLIDWNMLKRPMMRQMILRNPNEPCMNDFYSYKIEHFQHILGCAIDLLENHSFGNTVLDHECDIKSLTITIMNMDDYSTKIRIEAERLVKTEFPAKALELDALVSSQALSFAEVPKVRQETRLPTADELVTHFLQNNYSNTNSNNSNAIEDRKHANVKKRKIDNDQSPTSSPSKEIVYLLGTSVFLFPGGLIPSNGIIQSLEETLKPYIFHFLDSVAIIKLWIQLLIPKVEDGNNFGVSIQEDSLAEIRTLETDVTQYLDLTYRYLISRGELVKKVAKYPHVEDYRRSVQSLDEKQFISMRFTALELRNHYVCI
ncbi:unnamed protein product [Didymodactylos carnosus]|uniref:Uncharacterized protein n=1 Tax=Didymodactylos carnosus TaxID=1234261 RepID=A0A8S2CLW9_9BILA|nr:unnamed protein product [Didymodactylos carnosus]CAF3521687.1 unnamed protein product [Didymodactylos carnosus]